MELTLKERKKLTRVTAGRYRKAAKREKTAILDTFVEQARYERKYAYSVSFVRIPIQSLLQYRNR